MGKGRSLLDKLRKNRGSSASPAPSDDAGVVRLVPVTARNTTSTDVAVAEPPPACSDAAGDAAVDIWQRAEERIRSDAKKSKVFDSFVEILEKELGASLQRMDEPQVQSKARELLEAKGQELEDSGFVARTNTLKNVLFIRDMISSISYASHPAAVAGAGVCVILTVGEEQAKLLEGLKVVAAVICRVKAIQSAHQEDAESARRPAEAELTLREEFEASLVKLCAHVLEFQARALCYIRRHPVLQFLGDMFRSDGWDTLLQNMTKAEEQTFRFTAIINAAEVRAALKKNDPTIRRLQTSLGEVIEQWNVRTERKRKVDAALKLLYTCPYEDRKDRNKPRVEGTCQWFINHEKYHQWKQTGKLLWVSADPGCGKSVLARYLVDQVLPTNDDIICYFFFKDDFPDQRSSTNALCALLRQLIIQAPSLVKDSFLDAMMSDEQQLTGSFSSLWKYFLQVSMESTSRNIVCILDALDECQTDDRLHLIQALQQLDVDTETSRLRFLITSRPYAQIRRGFREIELKVPVIHLSGEGVSETAQISQEIDLVVQSRIEEISRKWSLEPDESDFLLQQLSVVPNRTYLWIQLTMDVIENTPQFTSANVRRAIASLPTTVDEAYEKILQRSSDPAKAERLLRIVTAATRPLTLEELSFGLALEDHHKSLDEVQEELEPIRRFRENVRDLCGLFINVVDSRVYLLHQTAREFLIRSALPEATLTTQPTALQWRHSLDLTQSHRILVSRCFQTLDIFEDRELMLGTSAGSSIRVFGAFNAFISYASRTWSIHFTGAAIRSEEPMSLKALKACYTPSESFHPHHFRQGGIGRLIDSPVDQPDLDKDSLAFLRACSLGLVAQAATILDKGVDIEIPAPISPNSLRVRMHPGKNALDFSVLTEDVEMTRFLLTRGAVTTGSKRWSVLPIHQAAGIGNVEIAELLLDHGAPIDIVHAEKMSPLSYAVLHAQEQMFDMLLERGADIDMDQGYSREEAYALFGDLHPRGGAILISAVRGLSETIFQKVLRRANNLEVSDRRGRTALLTAASFGNLSRVRALIIRGAKTEAVDSEYSNALMLSASSGNIELVKLLVGYGLPMDNVDQGGWTALHFAINNSHLGVVDALLRAGAKADRAGESGRTALSFAAEQGSIDIARILLHHGAAINSRDYRGRTPIHWAKLHVKRSMVEFLESRGAITGDCTNSRHPSRDF